MKVYDVIVEMDGQTVSTFDDIQAILDSHQDGDVCLLYTSLSKSGRGVSGRVSGKICMAGNASFMLENGIDTAAYNAQADALADDGKTPLFVCVDSQLAGIVAVADTVKEGAPEAIAEMKAMGTRTVMLTGDNQRTALAIKRIAHVDDVVAGVLPADKANYVEEQKKAGGCVAMVGDGINDAPALAAANAVSYTHLTFCLQGYRED